MSEYRKILHRLGPFRPRLREPASAECLLVRHAAYDYGREHLAGRSEWPLSTLGRTQAKGLIDLLPYAAKSVHASPRRRCIETIVPYAASIGRSIQAHADLDELDYGGWTGRSFAELESDAEWRAWNESRGSACPPGGETMRAAQARIVRHLAGLPAKYQGLVVVVTHAELIRAAILHCNSLPLDAWQSVDVPLASVTMIRVSASGSMQLERAPGTAPEATVPRPCA